ncbi:VOC family protein [Pseudonocardia xishanensis]|uniref:VOC family protein n=1 Tax=Pseudonocardia xishanensis TaxID=630995 RepID=A0ABP8RCS9_9PSEU
MTRLEQLYPRLAVRDADAAIAFYRDAFDAELAERYAAPDGTVVHALLRAGAVVWAVKEADEYDPGDSAVLALYVDDVDAVGAALEKAGAIVRFPIADQPYGERAGRFTDPFGHQWMVAQRTEDLTPEQIERRTREMFDS